MRRRGLAPITSAAAGAVLALVASAWLIGLWPSLGTARLEALPAGPAPAWANRLGLVDHVPGTSPNPLVEDRLGALGDSPGGERLRADLCSGEGMDADAAFRRVRAALVANNSGVCPGLTQRLQARAPLAVALGPPLGWPATLGLLALILLAGAAQLVSLKRRYDRWRLLGRSTFGAAREAGRG